MALQHRPAILSLLLGSLLLAPAAGKAAPAATPAPPAVAGSYLLAGAHAGWLFEPGRGARGFTAEALFHPDVVGQFSARLARQRLGLCLRFQRSVVVKRTRITGAEIALRRSFGREELPLLPFAELGLGQYRVADERGGGAASTWSAMLGIGAERPLGGRWLLAGAVQLRSLEPAAESLTHAGFTLTLGGRIDS